MTVDLVLKGGKIVTPTGVFEAGLSVDQSKIVAIAKEPHLPKADSVLDVRGLFVLPGVIDAHVHIFDPGFIRESFETGTRAAAAGGVTTVIDMASSMSLRSSTVSMLDKKKGIGERESLVDFALYGGEIADERDLGEIKELVEAGVVGFGEIMMIGDAPVKNDEVLLEALSLISSAKSVAAVHAENNHVINYYKKKLISEGRKDFKAFAEARPNLAEAEAVSKLLFLASLSGVKLHVCHLTTKEGVNLIRMAKAQGKRLTAEVCPHHLLYTRDEYDRQGPYIVTTPPLRTKRDITHLWNALNDNTIDMVVSDHCAFTKREKDQGREDVWNTPAGVPGLETLTAVMLGKGVNEGRITLQRFVESLSEKPAKIFGLYPRKGALQVGADADITIVDLKQKHRITAEDLQCVSDYTPYEGLVVKGRAVVTIVRGRIVAREGEVVGKPGHGKFIPARPPQQTI